MDYEWDTAKADTNFKKHGVSFEEAQTVFNNPLAMIFDDELHSSLAEYREIISVILNRIDYYWLVLPNVANQSALLVPV
jgi:uncharacterized DUF497 family protein